MQQENKYLKDSSAELDELAAEAHHALLDRDVQARNIIEKRIVRKKIRSGLLFFCLIIIFILVFFAQRSVPSPTPEQLERGKLAILGLISNSLANYFRTFGDYPENLEDALSLTLDADITYRRSGSGYEIILKGRDGQKITIRHS